VTPSARDVPLVTTTSAPATGSGLFVFDVGDDESFYDDPQPAQVSTEAHEALRRTAEVRAQIRSFLDDGVIVNPCDGACVGLERISE
jgi:hypothetical protein